jgi:hypothetical protein
MGGLRMDEQSFNPDFKTSIFSGIKSLTKEQVIDELEKNHYAYIAFKTKGIIDSKQFSFITKANFSEKERNAIDGAKNDSERLQAIENKKVVEDYFSNCNGSNLKVQFYSRRDNECILYNPSRINKEKLEKKFIEIFG